MMWVMEMSPSAMGDYLADTEDMDPKTERGYRRLAFYLRRFGSAPADERQLAGILGMTVRFLRDRAWPVLQERLSMTEDGRLFHPGVKRAVPVGLKKPVLSSRSQQASHASKTRWDRERRQREMLMEVPITEHGSEHARSMPGASAEHADEHARSMPGASALARAGTHTDSDSSLPEHLESPASESVLGEGCGEGEHAQPDAQPDAPEHTSPRRPHPLPADWQPNEAARSEAAMLGIDVDLAAEKMRRWATETGATSPDWDARFSRWLLTERQDQQGAKSRTGQAPQSPAPSPDDGLSAEEKALKARVNQLSARCYASKRDPVPVWAEVLGHFRCPEDRELSLEWLAELERWHDDGCRGDKPASLRELFAPATQAA